MAADGSEHHSAATNNLAGGEERSWGHKARQGLAVAGGGWIDGRNRVLTSPLSGAVSKHPQEQRVVKCGFP